MTSPRTDASRLDRPLGLSLPPHAVAAILELAGWNRRVLQVGHVDAAISRGLASQRCAITRLGAELDGAADPPPTDFDVALIGHALGSAPDPQQLLNRVLQLTAAGGRLILIAPNLAHADVRLALAQGRTDVSRLGVLEANAQVLTHEGLTTLLRKAGLAILDMARVRVPACETPLGADRLSVPTSALESLLGDPEAETEQFVLTAVRETAEHAVTGLFSRFERAKLELDRHIVAATRQTMELDALKRELGALREERERLLASAAEMHHRIETLTAEGETLRSAAARQLEDQQRGEVQRRQIEAALEAESERRTAAEHALAALQSTRTFRYARLPRAIYGFLLRRGR